MWETLIQFDKEIFVALNQFHSPFFDQLMWWISDKYIWIPLYAFLVYLIFRHKKKEGFIILVLIALVVTLSDQTSVKIFKEGFERLRPCHNPELDSLIHLVNNKCGGQYGFVSSHAANTFSVAVFLSLLLSKHIRRIAYPLLFWAMLVSYSRIYLGVHYPADIIGGAILGTFWGLTIYFGYSFTKHHFFRKFA
ncbi:MAG: phosphatase PAP2 family protein [Bacteroidales bacterium]